MAEWVATTNCTLPPAPSRAIRARSVSCRCGESAASGSSMMTIPGCIQLTSISKKASPWERVCKDAPP